MTKPILKQSESDIQKAIVQYLQLKGFYCLRINSGVVKSEHGGWMRMAPAGTPDIMAFTTAQSCWNHREECGSDIVFIEVKAPGQRASEIQLQTMQELERHGARTLVAHSVEEVEKWI